MYRDSRWSARMAQDAFEEGSHPRDHGKFSSTAGGSGGAEKKKRELAPGVKTKKIEGKVYNGETHDVHHEGKHLGTVYRASEGSHIRSSSGNISIGRNAPTWSAENLSGKNISKYSVSKKAAVQALLRHHGLPER